MQRLIKGLILIVGFLLVCGGIFYTRLRYFSPGTLTERKDIHYSNVPTVFIHGYEGSSFSFGPLLVRLEKENVAKREMTIVVQADGSLKVEGKLKNTNDNPMVMVLFAKDVTDEVFASELTAEGPSEETPIYQYFDRAMNQLPHNLNVLAIAGDLKDGSESDGSVSTHSAFALQNLFQKHAHSYQEMTVTGKSGGHSAITKSAKLRNKLIQFIWKKTARS